MNFLLTEAVNIDIDIQRAQISLYDALLPVWSTATDFVAIDGFGRVYKNERTDGIVPEIWRSDEQDYQEVYFNDRVSGQFFFIDSDLHTTEDDLVYSTELKIVFMVNLSQLKDLTERGDANVQRDVVTAIRNDVDIDFEITGIQTGIDNVFSGFDTSGIKKTQVDMQPLHVFSINGEFIYYRQDDCALYNT